MNGNDPDNELLTCLFCVTDFIRHGIYDTGTSRTYCPRCVAEIKEGKAEERLQRQRDGDCDE